MDKIKDNKNTTQETVKINVINKRNQKGVALLELIIAIGILGILSAAVVSLTSSAFAGLKQKQVIDNISSIKQGVASVYGAAGTYEGIDTTSTNVGAVDTFAVSEQVIENPFGDDIKFASSKWKGKDDKAYVISIPDLDSSSCVKVATALGASWDYMAVEAVASSGAAISYPTDIGTASVGTNVLIADGDISGLTPTGVATLCAPTSGSPVIILGAR